MLRTSALTFAIVTAVTSGAIVGTAATGTNPTDSTSCSCTTIDMEGGSVTLAVVTEGAGSTSVSQQVSQTNGDASVQMDVDYGDTSVEIAGETAENGSLVLDVTRDGETQESVVVDGETETVVFHLSSGGVRVSTDEELPSECTCDGNVVGESVPSGAEVAGDVMDGICDAKSDVEANVGDVRKDVNVNAGNVSVNVPIFGSSRGDGDQSAEANQTIENQSRSNAEGNDGDASSAGSDECAKESLDSGDSATPGRESNADSRVGGNAFRIVVDPTDFPERVGETGERGVSVGGLLSGFHSGTGDE